MSNVQDPTNTHDQEQGRAAHLDTAHVGNIEGAWGTINVNDMAPRKTWLKRLITLLVIMGPGLITMVGDNDAGGVATYTQAGRLACSSYAPTCSSRSSCSSSKRCNSLSVADTRDHLHAKTFAARSLHCIRAVRAWGSGQACVEVHARSDLKRGTNTMSTERVKPNPGRLDLEAIDAALQTVEMHWTQIDDELDRRGIGRKDTPFTALIRLRMMSAYQYLDELLAQQIPPFSRESIGPMLVLNERVHYGTDQHLMSEYARAMQATAEKFYQHIEPIQLWYEQHTTRGNHPLKLAAEIYVSILGYPQLYIEGNHRTGALIANWITVYHGFPPFILSVENAIAYFAPSAEIKRFVNKSTWRGQAQLPKYRKSFLAFWESHIDSRYLSRQSR